MQMSYWRFGLMIAASTVAMFGLMYLNVFALEHVFYSQTMMWMALYMGSVMAVIMLAFMWSMYKHKAINVAILVGSVVVFAGALWLVRSQETVGDVSYMKAMIPHHSKAILTSERAEISEPRVRHLADEIITAQRREIAEMRFLINDLETGGGETDPVSRSEVARIVPATEALAGAHIPSLDPATMSVEEIRKALGEGPICEFRYTNEGEPILAVKALPDGAAQGVVKLNGSLVVLSSAAADGALVLQAGDIRAAVDPDPEDQIDAGDDEVRREADLVFEIGSSLRVGYRGYYGCVD